MLGIAAVPAALIMLQPDLGTMLVLTATVFGVLAVAGVPRRWLIALFLAGGSRGGAGGPAGVLKQYQINRFMAFTDPALDPRGAGYNTTQARIAIGNGGLFGQGLFDGSQTRSRFVPEQHTDFIFTVAGEELGLIGAGVLILLFAALIWRALWISLHADDMFGRVAAAGIACWFAFQTFQNIGMCLGIMPVTGVPLPLVSYGGSSMFASMMALGLLQNIAMRGTLARRHAAGRAGGSGLGQGEGEGRAALRVAAGATAAPPCSATMRRVRARPRPVPGSGPSTGPRWNSSKISSSSPSGIPMPLSTTSTRTHPGSSSRSRPDAAPTGPGRAAVYLTALPTRLSSSWRSSPGSAYDAVVEIERNRGSAPSAQLARRLSTISLATSSSLTALGPQLAVLDDGVAEPVLDHLAHPAAGVAGLGPRRRRSRTRRRASPSCDAPRASRPGRSAARAGHGRPFRRSCSARAPGHAGRSRRAAGRSSRAGGSSPSGFAETSRTLGRVAVPTTTSRVLAWAVARRRRTGLAQVVVVEPGALGVR